MSLLLLLNTPASGGGSSSGLQIPATNVPWAFTEASGNFLPVFDYSAVPSGYGILVDSVTIKGTLTTLPFSFFGFVATLESYTDPTLGSGSGTGSFDLTTTTIGVPYCAPVTGTLHLNGTILGAIAGSLSDFLLNVTLVAGACGGSDMITFGCSAGESDSNGAALVIVTLKDSGGNPTAAPAGGQLFLLATTGGTLSATMLFIPQGMSSGNVVLQGTASGSFTVTVQASAGPCLGQTNCTVIVVVDVPPVSTLDGGTPDLCLIRETRANWRDTLRRNLGITPDVDVFPNGVPGANPFGEPWPTNPALNQAIAQAFQFLGRECHWHEDAHLSVDVPATTDDGPQFLTLTGVGGSPYQNRINTVDRCVFQDTSGQVYRLRARDYAALDRDQRLPDNNAPASIPREFYIVGYEIVLLPGASAGGTLRLYANTALIGFCSDSDTVDELPIDYHPVVQEYAQYLVQRMHPNNPEMRAQAELLLPSIQLGIKQVKRWLVMRNRDQQYSFTPTTTRRRRN